MSFLDDIEEAAKSCEFVADTLQTAKVRREEGALADRLRRIAPAWSQALGVAKLTLLTMTDCEDATVRVLAQTALDEIKRLTVAS